MQPHERRGQGDVGRCTDADARPACSATKGGEPQGGGIGIQRARAHRDGVVEKVAVDQSGVVAAVL